MDEMSALPPGVRLEPGEGGLERVVVDHPLAAGEVYLHGAHVTGWAPSGAAPVLWMSPRSRFTRTAAIRGGVPICFPWFGSGPGEDLAPAHGYARLALWRLVAADVADDGAHLAFSLPAGPWPLEATFRVGFGSRLRMELEVRNVGSESVTWEVALHTYLAVSDVRTVSVEGLEEAPFLDRNGGPEPLTQPGPIGFMNETDRIYPGSPATVGVVDPGLGRRVVVAKEGSASTVVWNPWDAKADAMADLGTGWPGFVCVETANVRSEAVTLDPGQVHTTTAILSVEPLG